MPIIKLSDHVINQIAAGEVVERPASVVKELIENSLDAGATKIDIEITTGGKSYIRVSDNGFGIAEADMPLVFERHATSKISSLQDLEQVVSLGFRGEALASISSVAKTTVKSKTADSASGLEIIKDGPQVSEIKAASMGTGTTIVIEDLFKNVPVRQKYLKTDLTEYGYIADIVLHHSAAQPEVEFTLIHNGQEKLNFPRTNDELMRALQILRLKNVSDVIPINYHSTDMKITGFVGSPQYSQRSRKKQYASVNQRPLSLPFADRAIRDAMHTLIPNGIYPIFVIKIEIDPTAVDINVHPRKLEARFAYQQFVYQKLKAAVKAAVEKESLQAMIQVPKSAKNDAAPLAQRSFAQSGSPSFPQQAYVPAAQTQFVNSLPVRETTSYERSYSGIAQMSSAPQSSLTPLVQIDDSYIIARDENGILIIDQHAAHERIRYYELQQNRKKYNKESETKAQSLLTPIEIEFTQSELALLEEFKEATSEIGFSYQINDGGVLLNSIPSVLSKEDFVAVLKGVVADLEKAEEDGLKFKDFDDRIETVTNYTACRSAIKFGRCLTHSEQLELLSRLEEVENNYSCPHGRPTRITLTFKELEKQFGRLGVQG